MIDFVHVYDVHTKARGRLFDRHQNSPLLRGARNRPS